MTGFILECRKYRRCAFARYDVVNACVHTCAHTAEKRLKVLDTFTQRLARKANAGRLARINGLKDWDIVFAFYAGDFIGLGVCNVPSISYVRGELGHAGVSARLFKMHRYLNVIFGLSYNASTSVVHMSFADMLSAWFWCLTGARMLCVSNDNVLCYADDGHCLMSYALKPRKSHL